MKMNKGICFTFVCVFCSLQYSIAAPFEKGSIIIRGGIAHVEPNDSSSEVTGIAESSVSVDGNTQLGLTGSYFFNENLALGLLASTPFSHDVIASGSIEGLGRIAEATQLPPTLTLQYHFPSSDKFKPYLGLGFNYTIFFDENSTSALDSALGGQTDVSLDNSFGVALEAGVDIALSDKWYLNVSAWYIDIDTTASLTTGSTIREVNVDIDPLVGLIAIGYRF